jgi:hypothetical protein
MKPKPGEQNLKYPILRLRRRARIFLLDHARLMTGGNDFEPEVEAGTEEADEAVEKSKGKWHHGTELTA